MHRVGAVEPDAARSHQQALVEALEGLERALRGHGCEARPEERVARGRVEVVEQVADPVVAGDAARAEQVRQLEREPSRSMRRWNARNDSHGVKTQAGAQPAASLTS